MSDGNTQQHKHAALWPVFASFSMLDMMVPTMRAAFFDAVAKIRDDAVQAERERWATIRPSLSFRNLFTHNAEPISDADIATVQKALMPHLLDDHSPEFDARALLIQKMILRIHDETKRADDIAKALLSANVIDRAPVNPRYVYQPGVGMVHAREDEPEPTGWIDWHGGACPVPLSTWVECVLDDGAVISNRAAAFTWRPDADYGADRKPRLVKRYRVVTK